MTEAVPPAGEGRWTIPMLPRSPTESHRSATPLELFFDLVFVVAIAQATAALHHAIGDGHAADGIRSYAVVFFAIWWAWMNFTWFASAYDTDDVAYRVVVFVQLLGALILAAGVEALFADGDLRVATLGYVVMRIALVTQWLRAARSDRTGRPATLRYAAGVTACQIGWVALLFAPPAWNWPGFGALVVAELAVPVWAESHCPTPWHRAHIAERYGLLTIIVLGESVLAASMAMHAAVTSDGMTAGLAGIIVGGLLIVFSLWWYYFDRPVDDLLTSLRRAVAWGYGHYLVFGAAGAVGAGLAVAADHATGHGEITDVAAGAVVALPVALYLMVLWALHHVRRREPITQKVLGPVVAALVLVTPFTGAAVLWTGVITASGLALKLAMRGRTA